jgi:NAD(P)-dependent dehydrogenase (short-subunit alcohol dehydrogenase family)
VAATKVALVTGSSGLIGSEMVSFLDERSWRVLAELAGVQPRARSKTA